MDLLKTPTGRKILFTSLYLSEGAPIGYIWWTIPTRLRVAGVSIEQITFLTSLLVLPWVFKFLWAPIIDTLQSNRWTLRSWIITTQIFMGITLSPLVFLDFQTDFNIVFILLLLHTLTAATQDASIDALSIASVPTHERGSINGWMQTGMLTGRALLGGGALTLGEKVGNETIIILLIGVIWFSTVLVLFSKYEMATTNNVQKIRNRVTNFTITLRKVLADRSTRFGLLFAFTAGAGYEAVGAVAGPYLIDRNFDASSVGFFFSVPVIVGMIGGALIRGYLSDKIGRHRSVVLSIILTVINITVLSSIDFIVGGSARMMQFILLSTMYVFIGFFIASSYALFMDMTDKKIGATQFSAFMGATNGCEAWATFGVGKIIPVAGYPIAFVVMGIISLSTIPIVRLLCFSKNRS